MGSLTIKKIRGCLTWQGMALVVLILFASLQIPVANALWRDEMGASGEMDISSKPAFTPTPSLLPTSSPSPSPSPSPTAAVVPCYLAELKDSADQAPVFDLLPGELFTQTWRFTNIGACDWSPEFHLEALEDNMDGFPPQIPLTYHFVVPGQEAEIILTASAPQIAGEYRIHYRMMAVKGKTTQPVEIRGGTDGDLLIVLRVEAPAIHTPTAMAFPTLQPRPTYPAQPSSTPSPTSPADTPTSLPPSISPTLIPSTDTPTPLPPSITSTPIPSTDTPAPLPPSITPTPIPSTETSIPLPPADTPTPLPPEDTFTPIPPADTPTAIPSPIPTNPPPSPTPAS